MMAAGLCGVGNLAPPCPPHSVAGRRKTRTPRCTCRFPRLPTPLLARARWTSTRTLRSRARSSPGYGYGGEYGGGRQEERERTGWLLWQVNALQRTWGAVQGLLGRLTDAAYQAVQPYNLTYLQVDIGVKIGAVIAALLVVRSLVSVFTTLAIVAVVAYAVLYLMRGQLPPNSPPPADEPEEAERPEFRYKGRVRRSHASSDLVDVWYEEDSRK
mmetsp:Transcript_6358/g.16359  ORF Transcript_6358/g.16359 Transcript_6358/m.16359 type:complete len:214 (-) Transcript_6358:129-770(-)